MAGQYKLYHVNNEADVFYGNDGGDVLLHKESQKNPYRKVMHLITLFLISLGTPK